MVGKRSGKALLREEGKASCSQQETSSVTNHDAGLERTDNNMEMTTWPVVTMINQKNYYTWVFVLDFAIRMGF
jgi:actin-related protein 8